MFGNVVYLLLPLTQNLKIISILTSNNQLSFQDAKIITSQFYNEWLLLSRARFAAYQMYMRGYGRFGMDLIDSIIKQLGYKRVLPVLKYDTLQKAVKNWIGEFPYLYEKPKGISTLSEKQLTTLNKFLNK